MPSCACSARSKVWTRLQPAFFALARARADVPAENCMFVGEDAAERAVASRGFSGLPAPAARVASDRKPLSFLRFSRFRIWRPPPSLGGGQHGQRKPRSPGPARSSVGVGSGGHPAGTSARCCLTSVARETRRTTTSGRPRSRPRGKAVPRSTGADPGAAIPRATVHQAGSARVRARTRLRPDYPGSRMTFRAVTSASMRRCGRSACTSGA